MKRIFQTAGVLMVLAVCIQGCFVPSVHPLYRSAEDIVFDPALVGRWTDNEGEVWEFVEKGEPDLPGDDAVGSSSHYLIVITDGDEPKGILEGRLVELGGVRFLDVVPYDFGYSTFIDMQMAMEDIAGDNPHGFDVSAGEQAPENGEGLWLNNALLFPTHTVLQVRLAGDTLELAFLDYEWMGERAEKGTLGLTHEIEDDLLLITASPEELQAFMRRHAGDRELFQFEPLAREEEK